MSSATVGEGAKLDVTSLSKAQATTSQKLLYLISTSSFDFGFQAAQALATTPAKHIVFVGVPSSSGNVDLVDSRITAFCELHNADIRLVGLDLTAHGGCANMVEHIFDSTGRTPNVVIHEPVQVSSGPAEAFTADQYHKMFEESVMGAHRLNQSVVPHMREAGWGHLIWLLSTGIPKGIDHSTGAYSAVNGALLGLAHAYTRDLKPWGVESTILLHTHMSQVTGGPQEPVLHGRPDIAEAYDEGPQAARGVADGRSTSSDVVEALVKLDKFAKGSKPRMVLCGQKPPGEACFKPEEFARLCLASAAALEEAQRRNKEDGKKEDENKDGKENGKQNGKQNGREDGK